MALKKAVLLASVGFALFRAALAEVPSSHPHAAQDHSLLCGLLQVEKRFQRAVDHCTAALTATPKDAEALSNRGAAYLQLGNVDMALADFNAAIAVNPNDGKHYFNRALVYSSKREHALAIADYDTALRLIPTLAIAYNNRAYEFERIGERDKAIADYRKAISVDGNLRSIVIRNLRRLGAEP